jgi:DNA replication protein DnaC
MSAGMLLRLCQTLKWPRVAREAVPLAAEAQRQGQGHWEYLLQCLQAAVDARAQRRIARCLREAGFPRLKTRESCDFRRAPALAESALRPRAEGTYRSRAETVILLGEPGTGKTPLAIALGVAAVEQGRRVRFVTAARRAKELLEARDSRARAWSDVTGGWICGSWMRSATCPSPRRMPSCCSRCSRSAMRRALWSSPRSSRLRNGPRCFPTHGCVGPIEI